MPNPNRDDHHDLPERTRDPGADPEDVGVPEVAEDLTPGTGAVADPSRHSMPTEQPAAVTDYGLTAEEHRTGEPLERKLARELPDDPDWAAEDADDDARPAEQAAMHVDEGPPSGDLPGGDEA